MELGERQVMESPISIQIAVEMWLVLYCMYINLQTWGLPSLVRMM